MRKSNFLIVALSLAVLLGHQAWAQTHYNIAAGYYAENITSPGFVLELEREKFHSDLLSIPIQLDFIGFFNPDYNGMSIELKTGYRKYFNNGLFFEQSIGLGYQFTNYNTDMWNIDKCRYSGSHGNEMVSWLTPSTSIGIGYNLSHKKDGNHLVWIRPKLFWLPGFRGMNLPYSALQIGYTYNFK